MIVQEKLKQLREELDAFQDQFPKVTPDNLFVTWFLRAYLTESDQTAIEAVTGRARDKGIDAILTDDKARVVYLIQAKYRHARFDKPEARSSVVDFATIAQTLYEPDNAKFTDFLKGTDAVVNELLRETRKRLHRNDYRLVLIFVTLGRCSASLERDAKA